MFADYLYQLATDRKKGVLATLLKFPLYLLSLVYGLAVGVLIFIYRLKPRRPGCKVISVGNITLGGTGKTPLVVLIAEYLRKQGRKVAVVSRGYKKKGAAMGDEPLLLSRRLKDIPVIVEANRLKASARAVRDYQADTVIFDDGFQQWKIAKDLEVVVLDSRSPFGNHRLLPRGILREPLGGLKRADVFILSKANLYPPDPKLKALLGRINPRALIAESAHQPAGFYRLDNGASLGQALLPDKRAVLFSGIGDPGSFEELVRRQGVEVVSHLSFCDHHNYSRKDLEDILGAMREKNTATLITTEKDALRLSQLGLGRVLAEAGRAVFYLALEVKLSQNEQEFYSRLLGLYSA